MKTYSDNLTHDTKQETWLHTLMCLAALTAAAVFAMWYSGSL